MAHYNFNLSHFARYPPPPSSFIPPPELFPELYEETEECNMDTSAQEENLEGFGQENYECGSFEAWPGYINYSEQALDIPSTGCEQAMVEESSEKVTDTLPLSEIKTKEDGLVKELQMRKQIMKEGVKREMKEQKPHKRKWKKRKYLKRTGA